MSTTPPPDAPVTVWVDFNTIETRPDGRQELTTAWHDGLDLRQAVTADDGEGTRLPGVVSGLKDHGRGPLLTIELTEAPLRARLRTWRDRFRERMQRQTAGDNSTQIQIGNWDDGGKR
jgi:hypothetical protein